MPSKSYPGTRTGPAFNANRSSLRSTLSSPSPAVIECGHDDEEKNIKSSSGVQVEQREHVTNDTTQHNDNNATFGDILSHLSEFHRHQLRMHSYRRQVEAWENMTREQQQR